MSSPRSLAWIAAFVFVLAWEIGSLQAANGIDPSGTWTWVRELEGQEAQSVLTLSYKEGKLTGFYKRMGRVVPIASGKVDKNEISFEADGSWNDQKIHGKFKGKLSHDAKRDADEINGTIEIVVEDGSLPLAWVARRGIDADDIVGNWKLKLVTPDGNTIEPELKLASDAGSLKGTYLSPRFGEHEAKDIKLDGSEICWTVEFEQNGRSFKGTYKGKLEAGASKAIKGTLALDANGNTSSLEFTGERTGGKAVTDRKDEGKKEAEKPQATPNSTDKKSSSRTAAKRRVIVMLKSRHAMIVVYCSAGKERGPLFSIRSTDGKEIAHDLSLKDLQASYPQIYDDYRTSFASLSADTQQRPATQEAIAPSLKRTSSPVLYPGVDFGPE